MPLSIRNVSKTYPNGVRALNNVSLEIGNQMFGLLGPNGSGKSTLMRTIAALQEADTGEIVFNGIKVSENKDEIRRLLGYLPQEFGVYPRISAYDMLNHLAVMKGLTKASERKEIVEALLQQTNLWEHRKKSLSTYSGGMKQRFGIAQALLANPQLIIVDEPTAGLDPAERNRFLNLLSSIGRDVVVILSTHIVEDVRELCPHMAIISNGHVLLDGAPEEALGKLRGRIYNRLISDEQELQAVTEHFNVVSTKLYGGAHQVRIYSDAAPGEGFLPIDPDLEDVYFLSMNDGQGRQAAA